MTIDTYRVAVISLCVSAALSLSILFAVYSIRTKDLERLQKRDMALIKEGQEAHDALCVLKQGYFERQRLFHLFLDDGMYSGEGERLLVKGLIGSFDTTLFALRNLTCEKG